MLNFQGVYLLLSFYSRPSHLPRAELRGWALQSIIKEVPGTKEKKRSLWELPFLKLTFSTLQMVVSNRNLLFQVSIFRGYVSFREGILPETNSKFATDLEDARFPFGMDYFFHWLLLLVSGTVKLSRWFSYLQFSQGVICYCSFLEIFIQKDQHISWCDTTFSQPHPGCLIWLSLTWHNLLCLI